MLSHVRTDVGEKALKLPKNTAVQFGFLVRWPRVERAITRKNEGVQEVTEQIDDLSIRVKAPPLTYKALERVTSDAPRNSPEPVRPPGTRQQSPEDQSAHSGYEVDRRTLIVGQGISLSGEVTSCERLIVEGSIEARLQKCQHVIIGETGFFHGNASTENADVRGRFEGELVVRKRLHIRAGGHVYGTITYGEIEIESGGAISGTIEKAEASEVGSTFLPMSA
jgi:cytoskeletal protein CcmA (bactofilin family)